MSGWSCITRSSVLAVLAAGTLVLTSCMPRKSTLLEPGTETRTLEVDGRSRSVRFHVPPGYDAHEAVPAILAFHGRLGTGSDMAKLTKLDEAADRQNLIVAYPDGYRRSWNAGLGAGPAEQEHIDDIDFIATLIEYLEDNAAVDHRRVYAVGMSTGGSFAYRLACELTNRVAAIASVAGPIATAVLTTCQPSRSISVVHIHGTADPIVPIDGGLTSGGGRVASASDTIAFWVKHDACPTGPQVDASQAGVTGERFGPCAAGTEVTLYRVHGSGHTWPGGWQYMPRTVIGDASQALDATETIVQFLLRQSLD